MTAQVNNAVRKIWTVGELMRLPAYGGGFRVWRVIGVFLGGENQEGVVELETVDRMSNTEGRLLIPEELLSSSTVRVLI